MKLSFFCSEAFYYLRYELVSGNDVEEIGIYINDFIPENNCINDVLKYIPKSSNAINGIFLGHYVSYYFQGKIIVITDVKKRVTYAKIEKEYEDSVKSLFLTGIFRNHMNRHWIAHGYHIYHASGLYDKKEDKAFLVLGAAGAGKTTFALEAIKSGRYLMISEDKVIVDSETDLMFGCSITHVNEQNVEMYKDYIHQQRIINGGNIKKYSFTISDSFYKVSAKHYYTIFLNCYYESKSTFYREVNDKDMFQKLVSKTQEGIYILNESQQAKKAYQYISEKPMYEIHRGENEYNFEIFQKNMR